MEGSFAIPRLITYAAADDAVDKESEAAMGGEALWVTAPSNANTLTSTTAKLAAAAEGAKVLRALAFIPPATLALPAVAEAQQWVAPKYYKDTTLTFGLAPMYREGTTANPVVSAALGALGDARDDESDASTASLLGAHVCRQRATQFDVIHFDRNLFNNWYSQFYLGRGGSGLHTAMAAAIAQGIRPNAAVMGAAARIVRGVLGGVGCYIAVHVRRGDFATTLQFEHEGRLSNGQIALSVASVVGKLRGYVGQAATANLVPPASFVSTQGNQGDVLRLISPRYIAAVEAERKRRKDSIGMPGIGRQWPCEVTSIYLATDAPPARLARLLEGVTGLPVVTLADIREFLATNTAACSLAAAAAAAATTMVETRPGEGEVPPSNASSGSGLNTTSTTASTDPPPSPPPSTDTAFTSTSSSTDTACHPATTAVPSDIIPLVEQMVGAYARVFVGTLLSTFSGAVQRYRGYLREAHPSWAGHDVLFYSDRIYADATESVETLLEQGSYDVLKRKLSFEEILGPAGEMLLNLTVGELGMPHVGGGLPRLLAAQAEEEAAAAGIGLPPWRKGGYAGQLYLRESSLGWRGAAQNAAGLQKYTDALENLM